LLLTNCTNLCMKEKDTWIARKTLKVFVVWHYFTFDLSSRSSEVDLSLSLGPRLPIKFVRRFKMTRFWWNQVFFKICKDTQGKRTGQRPSNQTLYTADCPLRLGYRRYSATSESSSCGASLPRLPGWSQGLSPDSAMIGPHAPSLRHGDATAQGRKFVWCLCNSIHRNFSS